jgi:RsiW-degrading membrane proteinase PrsW (M82 family)
MFLLNLSIAPVFIILFYIYLRDKYEKEPLKLLLKILLFGALTVIPALIIETALSYFGRIIHFIPIVSTFYGAFVVAAITEETLKFSVIYLFIWKNKEFNEKFDGIVYAVFASLGFALVENVMYVFQYGSGVGLTRAFTAVPAHTIFGISMGFFFGLAKFTPNKKSFFLTISLLLPIILHGIYDFILMSEEDILLVLFVPYLIGILFFSFKLMKKHSDNSKFNPNNIKNQDNTIF